MPVDQVLKRAQDNDAAAIQRLMDWLRIPSISTDPQYRDSVRKAAEWAADQLRTCGGEVTIEETGTKDKPGHPIVMAEFPGRDGYSGPHVLFYGHYDVQPPDPLDLWHSPPFEPVLKPADPAPPGREDEVPGERIVARGAVDDKGQVASFLEALRAWREAGDGVPARITVLLEGEEESGSVNLERFVRDNRDRLAECDICVISDTGMLGRTQPAITYGVRGLCYTEVILHASDQDLHSGSWGGRAPNPINELTKVLAQLWDADRRVTIPGFYTRVKEPTPDEREAWRKLPFDQAKALKKIGLGPEADIGEAGYSALEREWARPTCDVNGIYGGYMGKGAKTVIPSYAGAKVSFRLVADQDPHEIAALFRGWLEQRTPPGCRFEFHDHGGGFPGNVATDSPYLAAARRALAGASGTDPFLIKAGGSIPVVGLLKADLDLDTLLLGFGLDDDRVHSPNEKFELSCFRLGVRTHIRLMDEFARMGEK